MSKCPACGYDSNTNYKNIGINMNTILKSKSRNTVKMLNKIASKVSQHIPSETRLKYYQFLYATKDVDDNVMECQLNNSITEDITDMVKVFLILEQ